MDIFGHPGEELDLSFVEFTPELLQTIPASIALKYKVLPVSLFQNVLGVAMSYPFQAETIDEVYAALKVPELQLHRAHREQLNNFVQNLYGDAK